MLIKLVKTKDLFSYVPDHLFSLFNSCEYPWEILPKIKDYIVGLIKEGMQGYTLIADNVLVGENVKIYDTAVIEAPAIIGAGSEVRPGAFIRGNVIVGENCVVGNSSELKKHY